MSKKYNWRTFFTDFTGERYNLGYGEEVRYQAFKARFLEEQHKEKVASIQRQERIHNEALEDAMGTHGQG